MTKNRDSFQFLYILFDPIIRWCQYGPAVLVFSGFDIYQYTTFGQSQWLVKPRELVSQLWSKADPATTFTCKPLQLIVTLLHIYALKVVKQKQSSMILPVKAGFWSKPKGLMHQKAWNRCLKKGMGWPNPNMLRHYLVYHECEQWTLLC